MKKIIFFLCIIATFILSACKKDSTVTDLNTSTAPVTIRYTFTATVPGNYSFQAIADSVVFSEFSNTAVWTKTLTVPPGNSHAVDSAKLTVFPPVDWVGTGITSDVVLKIFINDQEKASKSGQLLGVDRPNGISVMTTY